MRGITPRVMSKEEYLKGVLLGSREAIKPAPQETIPEKGMSPEIAEEIVRQIRLNEAKADQNLATFCTTTMDPQANELILESLNTNAIDKSEYPKTTAIENYTISMIAHLWHIGDDKKLFDDFIGTSTVGSSEGCMLGGLALLFSWKHHAEAVGMDVNDLNKHRPNLVITSGYQVVWEKFCTYWNVEMRQVPMHEGCLEMDTEKVMDYVDENTIGIIGIMGITYTGGVDDIERLDQLVEEYNKTAKIPIKIHVDAATGGFFAPFVDNFKPWDFRLKNVASINVSGHKYGLVYPGIGWVIWRENNEEYLPKEMRFSVKYLGGTMDSIAINFSHSGAHIVAQYYNLIRFGREGWTAIMQNNRKVARYLATSLEETGLFELITDGKELPIICWKLADNANVEWTLYDLEDALKEYGWQVPAYPLPANLEDTTITRVVVRPTMTMTICDDFLSDLRQAITDLNKKHK